MSIKQIKQLDGLKDETDYKELADKLVRMIRNDEFSKSDLNRMLVVGMAKVVRTCSNCGLEKAFEDFPPKRRQCRDCVKEHRKVMYNNYAETLKERRRLQKELKKSQKEVIETDEHSPQRAPLLDTSSES